LLLSSVSAKELSMGKVNKYSIIKTDK